jgi:hypothetical protein
MPAKVYNRSGILTFRKPAFTSKALLNSKPYNSSKALRISIKGAAAGYKRVLGCTKLAHIRYFYYDCPSLTNTTPTTNLGFSSPGIIFRITPSSHI